MQDLVKNTLLIEKLNNQKSIITDYISDEFIGMSDTIYREIEERFICSSWDDVIKKLDPHVYILIDTREWDVKIIFELDENTQNEHNEIIKIDFENIAVLNKSLEEIIDALLVKDECANGFFTTRDEIITALISNDRNEARNKLIKFVSEYNSICLLYIFLKYPSKDYVYKKNSNKFQLDVIEDRRSSTLNEMAIFYDFINDSIDDILVENKELWCACLRDDVTKKSKFQTIYKELVRKFWTISKFYVEKLMGIYSYFKSGEKDVRLIISNMTLEEIIHYEEKLNILLEFCNEKISKENEINYAILTNADRKKEKVKRVLSYFALKNIKTFISTSYEVKINDYVVDELEVKEWYSGIFDVMNSGNKHICIPCFPNFTFIPNDMAVYKIKERKVYLKGITVDSAYIAAGICENINANIPRLNFIEYKPEAKKFLLERVDGVIFQPGIKTKTLERDKDDC